jgi:hypothetical protein
MVPRTTVIDNFAGGIVGEKIREPLLKVIRRKLLWQAQILPDMIRQRHVGPVRFFDTGAEALRPLIDLVGRLFFNLDEEDLNIYNDGWLASVALQTQAGNFALNTSTGSQSITGVGFQPQLVLFIGTPDTANVATVAAHNFQMVGLATASNQGVVSMNSEDNQDFPDVFGDTDNSSCILIHDVGVATIDAQADLTSMDTDGFTINVSTAPGSAYRIGYLALGGSLSAYTDRFTSINGLNQTKAITGVGFQPSFCFFASSGYDNANSAPNMAVAGLDTSDAQAITTYSSTVLGDLSTSDTFYRQGSSEMYTRNRPNLGGTSQVFAFDLDSFDSDGFTINTNSNFGKGIGQTLYIYFTAIKDSNVKKGTVTLNTSTGTQSVTGVGFQPKAGIFLSVFNSATSQGDEGRFSLGFAVSSSQRFCIGGRETDAVDTTEAKHWAHDSYIARSVRVDGTVDEAVDLDSFDSDGFTIDIETAVGANPTVLRYILFG